MLALVWFALLQGSAQIDTVYTGQTTVLAVEELENVDFYWQLYNDVEGINFVTVPGNCPPSEAYFVNGISTGDSVEVMWLMPGTYFFTVTAYDTCTNNLKVGKIVVLESTSVAIFLDPEPVCEGDTAWMTIEISGGIGPWDITFTNGDTTWTFTGIEERTFIFPLVPTPPAAGDYQYWITSVTSGTGFVNNEPSEPVTLTVMPRPVTSPIYRYDPMSKK